MQPYSLFLHADSDAVPSFELVMCDDDDGARAYALRELLGSPRHREAEVVDGHGESFRVSTHENTTQS